MTKRWSIGIDLGGTKIIAAQIDEEGTVQNRVREKTNVASGPEGVQNQIEKLAQSLIKESPTAPVSLGIGVAGQINKQTGAVTYAPNLKWHNVPLDAALEKTLGIPVTVLNDVRAAAWGEWLHGAGQGCRDMVCVFVGTGVGGGIVSEGRMLEGGSNCAGEVGHMTVLLDGPECHCGNRGCLEALAGSWAIERDAAAAVGNNPADIDSRLAQFSVNEKLTAKTVIQAYNDGDELAKKVIDGVINALAGSLTGLTNALNPEHIVMGGGVIEHVKDIIPKIQEKVHARALEAALNPLKIVPTGLEESSGMIGAAAYTLRKETNQLYQTDSNL